MTVPGVVLGAPGVYRAPRRSVPRLRPERLDVAGFVGVAARGPVDEPVAVESWSEFLWWFGGTGAAGLLPRAVRAFFAQGGARAVVLRVSPLPRGDATARARHRIDVRDGGGEPVLLGVVARNEGSWGDGLRVRLDFAVATRFRSSITAGVLDLPDAAAPAEGSLVRLRGTGLPPEGVFAWTGAPQVRDDGPGRRRRCTGVEPAGGAGLPPPARPGGTVEVDVDVVTAALALSASDADAERVERFADLGMHQAHPRFAERVLAADSRLAEPDGPWGDAFLPPTPFLDAVASRLVAAGRDRLDGIGEASFFGDLPPSSLPLDGVEGLTEGASVHGVDRMSLVREIALLCVPDLLWNGVVEDAAVHWTPAARQPWFAACQDDPAPVIVPPRLRTVLLDGATQREDVLRRQRRVVDLADRQRRFVALLDVPPHLQPRAVVRWRTEFDSSYAAAYHPWLGVVDDRDPGGTAVIVPPSGFVAGIVAARELRLGLPWGPANELAIGAVTAADPMTDADHDTLHLAGVNVVRRERDGFRLTAARTLSSDPEYRQLSVRRLMTMLRLVVDRQLQWLAFEPNHARLRRDLTMVVTTLLRELFRQGAFAGTGEQDSFFVRCDGSANPRWSLDQGRLIAEIGVAPAEPLEYLVLRVARTAEGALTLEADT